MFPEATSWELATIFRRREKIVFCMKRWSIKRTEVIKKLNDETTLIYYKKER